MDREMIRDWVTGTADTFEVSNMRLGAIVTGMDDGNCRWADTKLRPQCTRHLQLGREDNLDDTAANFSNYIATANTDDVNHAIVVSGVCIRSTWKGDRKRKNGTCKTISGTNMTSSHVAGTTALCIASDKFSSDDPEVTLNKIRADAEAQPESYGYDEDPNRGGTTTYYGYLEYAGDY